ncbi:PREDICTED: XK-related protein 9 isoform X1 [Thamnophis sirtalis]|uniref:XK-related protein n=1 Tax=Thamnophis sirtalis TaxID=35019 RepID=A0A6I9XMU4_9SAUR|nr:PREDICTED: XK-related protein 9 isoform X1 [Thamnophis sirtalis]
MKGSIVKKQQKSFSKVDFLIILLGLLVYTFDIGTDLWMVKNFLCEGQYLKGILILLTGLYSSIIIQFFSCAWFKEDENEKFPWTFYLLHSLNGGLFTRYYLALKHGYEAVYIPNSSTNSNLCFKEMVYINILQLFKAFLESTPQLILQIYIVMVSDDSTFSQYLSIALSFCSISCATVNFQIIFRKYRPDKNEFSGVFCKLIYLFYKLMTLTSWILTIVLLSMLNIIGSIVLLIFLWFGNLIWVITQSTDFCKFKTTEYVYRMIVAIILMFTFFNVKGENTAIVQRVYYVFRIIITVIILCICGYWKSLLDENIDLSTLIIIIVIFLILGIISLIIYYIHFHPNIHCTQDEMDGLGVEREDPCRISKFLIQ